MLGVQPQAAVSGLGGVIKIRQEKCEPHSTVLPKRLLSTPIIHPLIGRESPDQKIKLLEKLKINRPRNM